MAVTITCYGGVGEIGGNKILITDKDTKVFLDFGLIFSVRLSWGLKRCVDDFSLMLIHLIDVIN